MENERRIAMSVREVRETLGTTSYDNVIENLLKKAYFINASIAFYDNRLDSVCETITNDTDDSITYLLRIKKKPTFGNVKEIIFDIIHEMGHALDENKLKDKDSLEEKYNREIRAWEIADKLFAVYPELQADESEYSRYKRECLNGYERGLALKKRSHNAE